MWLDAHDFEKNAVILVVLVLLAGLVICDRDNDWIPGGIKYCSTHQCPPA